MTWFFYNGSVPVPVRHVSGTVVSVAPRSKIEANAHDVSKYRGAMRECAEPVEAIPVDPVPKKHEVAVSPIAKAITEMGITLDPKMVPKKAATQPRKTTGRRKKPETGSKK